MSSSTPPTPSASSPILTLSTFSSTSTTRLQALYSDFSRQKHSNPASFQANVEWWRKALEEIAASGFQSERYGSLHDTKRGFRSRLILHANATLLDQVKIPRVGKPLALGTVLFELHSARALYPLSEFMSLKASIYSTHSLPIRIASYVVGKPLWWALEQIGIVGEEGLLSSHNARHHHKGTAWHGDYVIISLVVAAAEAILEMQRERMGGPADRLYSLDSFRRVFAAAVGSAEGMPIEEQDAKVVLKFLERDRGVLVYDNEVIKFVGEDEAEDRTITAVDRGILELKTAVHSMHMQIESVQQKIDQCTDKASAALQKDRKPLALSYIRSRKQLQEVLTKRLGSLATLESTLIAVEAAAGDVEIMKSYESSAATLKAILSHSSLQRENIDKTMDALAEANADAREIDAAVRIGGDSALGIGENVDEADIEAEWAELVKQMEADHVGGKLSSESLKVPHGTTAEGTNVPERIPVAS